MGLFSFLFKKPPVIQDDLFGALRVVDEGKDGYYMFEGNTFFGPANGEIGILIGSFSPTPTLSQKKFFTTLQQQYDRYVPHMQTRIESEFRKWKQHFTVQDFKAEFIPDFLDIPAFDTIDDVWSLSFTTIHDGNHTLTFRFRNNEITEMHVDG
ncbi:hypothetical protein [Chitinophaga agri]|uniref:DUF2262 domain-containing protein n=1 Tax=Chitinophaga agri TaxID=2703787 RepID=A0A6B9Z9H0_9BACT|nr:hypothetical protein [Chitinophaga agri]QHS58221.1 hypothetical protein GWR21_01015 [Chitinophaga agri]